MAGSQPRTVVPLRPARTRREPLWRDAVGRALRQERRRQGRTLREVAEAARISLPYLSEVERGRKEASSEILAAAAGALGLGLGDVLRLVHREVVQAAAGMPSRPLSGLPPAPASTAPAGPPAAPRSTGTAVVSAAVA
jgi:transcriptional regulator with XRE-family HTH domain